MLILRSRWLAFSYLICLTAHAGAAEPPMWPGFTPSPWFEEQVCERRVDPGVRFVINTPRPERIDLDRPTRVVFFATPNGNTIEQTLGCRLVDGLDWHYDIQHIAAQTRKLRQVSEEENIILVCLEADGLSWPGWRRKHPDNAALIRRVVDAALALIPIDDAGVTLSCHSGGGSLLFGFINAADDIPDSVDRIIFLDANYGYNDDDRHGDKLLDWLDADDARRLIVLAYDDRNITLNGKRVVGPTGGTFRATHRMIDRFSRGAELQHTTAGDFDVYAFRDGRIRLLIHRNPQNIILHTRLVGEMNGHLYTLALGTPAQERWGTFGGPRAYTEWVQPPPALEDKSAAIADRPVDAPGGRAFMRSIAELPPAERERAIRDELIRGNVPAFLREFKEVRVMATDRDGVEHTAVFEVMPDYLAVGSDDDYVRVPMTPMTAQAVADRFGCVLPTRKMVDDVHAQAEVKLAPRPLTEDREAVATFVQHHDIIERQRGDAPLGQLTSGIKKDVVVTNRLAEKPRRVAIFGWHRLDGRPIQPLTIVHVDTYVDYSHGVRLVRRIVEVDGQAMDIVDVMSDPRLCALLSNEGVIHHARYETVNEDQ